MQPYFSPAPVEMTNAITFFLTNDMYPRYIEYTRDARD